MARIGRVSSRFPAAVAAIWFGSGVAGAQTVTPNDFSAAGSPNETVALAEGEHAQQLSDLTLLNFFSEGWGEQWEKRRRTTPDMALLRVTTNFLEREFRLDYVRTDVANNPKLESTDLANALIAYGLNRRLMIELIVNYQWNVPFSGFTTNGSGGGLLARFQLVDTPTQSYSFQTRVSAPNKGLGQTQTSFTYALAGWQDMHALVPALGRFGLYGSFQYENLVGPHKAGATQNDVSYDVSLAETWTCGLDSCLRQLHDVSRSLRDDDPRRGELGKDHRQPDSRDPILVRSRELADPRGGLPGQQGPRVPHGLPRHVHPELLSAGSARLVVVVLAGVDVALAAGQGDLDRVLAALAGRLDEDEDVAAGDRAAHAVERGPGEDVRLLVGAAGQV